jgi:transcriptional repressor NrdR
MHCINCGYEHSKVVETEHSDRTNQTRRRRECVKCGQRFTTHERMREQKYQTPPPKRILER